MMPATFTTIGRGCIQATTTRSCAVSSGCDALPPDNPPRTADLLNHLRVAEVFNRSATSDICQERRAAIDDRCATAADVRSRRLALQASAIIAAGTGDVDLLRISCAT